MNLTKMGLSKWGKAHFISASVLNRCMLNLVGFRVEIRVGLGEGSGFVGVISGLGYGLSRL